MLHLLIHIANIDTPLLVEHDGVMFPARVDCHIELILIGVGAERFHNEGVQTTVSASDLSDDK